MPIFWIPWFSFQPSSFVFMYVQYMSRKKLVYIINFLRKSSHFCDNMENYVRSRQATDDNRAHAHCMLITMATDTNQNMQSLLFCDANIVTRTHLNVTLHLHGLSQNTPMTEEVLSGQGNQWTFKTLITSLAIIGISYSILRDSGGFLLLYSRWR